MFIIGRKSDESFVVNTGTYSSLPSESDILKWAVDTYGGKTEDYSLYVADQNAIDRIMGGDSFELIWEDNEVVGADFSIEDSKQRMNVSCDKVIVKKDGIDKVHITAKVYYPNTTDIDANFEESILIPMSTPAGVRELMATFTNGICEYDFEPHLHTTSVGEYKIPCVARIDDFKVDSSADFKVVIPVGV